MDDKHEIITVYFNPYTRTSPAHALDMVGYVTTLFDEAAISVSGYGVLYFTRDIVVPLHDIGSDPPVYGYAIHYDVHLEA
jgi:hypothetical protein